MDPNTSMNEKLVILFAHLREDKELSISRVDRHGKSRKPFNQKEANADGKDQE